MDEQNKPAAALVYGCGLGCVCTAAFQHGDCNADHSTLTFAAPTSRVHQSIDTPEFKALLCRCFGVKDLIYSSNYAPLVAHIDAKLAQAREQAAERQYFQGYHDAFAVFVDKRAGEIKGRRDAMKERAKAAEAQLAAIRAGLEGLTRIEPAVAFGVPCASLADDGRYIIRTEVLALLQPQQKSDTPR